MGTVSGQTNSIDQRGRGTRRTARGWVPELERDRGLGLVESSRRMTLLDEETRQLSNHGRVQWMGRGKREKGHIGGMIRQDLLDGGICENNWASIYQTKPPYPKTSSPISPLPPRLTSEPSCAHPSPLKFTGHAHPTPALLHSPSPTHPLPLAANARN